MNEHKLGVFNIIESKDGKSRWVKVGTAFTNRDGSINVLLDVYPRDGKLQIRECRQAAAKQGPTGMGSFFPNSTDE